jgi:glycosyltransferase involved in cell wall biosynthesis
VTWQHKNHLRLLEALALLRDERDLVVRLVCTGSTYAFWPAIERRIKELNLESQVKFLGFVPEEELRALYRLSQFLIMPTLFEASSLPIFEAWFEGVAVASSNVTALPEQVLDAALMFDPTDTRSIANAIEEISSSAALRQELIDRGYRRLADFDCERTARMYRAVYRRAANYPLTPEDRRLLAGNAAQASSLQTSDIGSFDMVADPTGQAVGHISNAAGRMPALQREK